jgi:hypothetical protein
LHKVLTLQALLQVLEAIVAKDSTQVAGQDIREVLALDLNLARELTCMLHRLPPLQVVRGATVVQEVRGIMGLCTCDARPSAKCFTAISIGDPEVGSIGDPEVGSIGDPEVGSIGDPEVGSIRDPEVGSC